MLKYEKLVLGELGTNCYVVYDEQTFEGVVIDPADDGVEIAQRISEKNIRLTGILATHGHFDHLLGALDLKLIFSAPLYCHDQDMFLLERQRETAGHFLGGSRDIPNITKIDVDLANVQTIKIGDEELEVILCPGHTPGGVSFYYKKEGWLFCGDTLFAEGGRGDTSHTYSSDKQIFESIKTLLKLPTDTLILPGHGEETTVGNARKIFGD